MVKEDGTSIKAWQVDMGGSKIYYRTAADANAPLQSIDKASILMWKKADGTRIMLDQDGNSPSTQPQQPQPQTTATTQPATAVASSDNSQLLARYNQVSVDYIDKAKDKKAKMLYCQLGVTDNSVLTDGNIKLSFATGNIKSHNYNDPAGFYHSGFSQDMEIEVTIYNLQSHIIYIDQANTFILRNGEATAYYVPTATSTTTTKSSGVGVNMGAVAGALGVGGVAGKLANGVTVGGGNTHGTISTVYSQRIISIPPKSAKKLQLQDLFPAGSIFPMFKAGYTFGGLGTKLNCAHTTSNIAINIGEKRQWSEADSPQTFGIHVAYSQDESCQSLTNMHADFYMKEMTGASKGGYVFEAKMKNFTNNWPDALYFIVNND